MNARDNMTINADPQRQEATSPQVLRPGYLRR